MKSPSGFGRGASRSKAVVELVVGNSLTRELFILVAVVGLFCFAVLPLGDLVFKDLAMALRVFAASNFREDRVCIMVR